MTAVTSMRERVIQYHERTKPRTDTRPEAMASRLEEKISHRIPPCKCGRSRLQAPPASVPVQCIKWASLCLYMHAPIPTH
jgi:hypothetical protein